MRDFKGMKRQRGRNRKPGSGGGNNNANATNPNRSWDSQGPENIKVRGNAQTVYERYMQLARDASAAGDRVLAENYTQHAEHYFRVLRALQPSRPVSEIAQRELAGQGFDIDFEDETGAQAAAIMAAEKVEADRLAQIEARQREAEERQNDRPNDRQNDRQGEQPRREWRDRDDQPRQDREPREPREPRAEGEGGFNADGSRRETRRERWERRQQERSARFEREGGEPRAEGDAPAAQSDEAPEVRAEAPERADRPERAERPARAERPERKPRRDAGVATDDGPSALPGFLTRSTAPAPAATAPESVDAPEEAAAPKRRAPRRKVEAPAAED